MPQISKLADVHPQAALASDVQIGPFCSVGPSVTIGEGTVLHSHVVVTGRTDIGSRNRFFPNAVIGAEPQDLSFSSEGAGQTWLEIGDDNVFREGVTVNRGAQKENFGTTIGHGNMLMSNAHVAHNCRIHNRVILVNGVLLGGHVHVHDRAIVSGNSVVHHYSTIGTLAFVSGGCRVPHDVPPYLLSAGSDNPTIRALNMVGLKRAGVRESAIRALKRAYRLIYRENCGVDEARDTLTAELGTGFPLELSHLLTFVQKMKDGRFGRSRELGRSDDPPDTASERKAA